jgi:hypothetical protein
MSQSQGAARCRARFGASLVTARAAIALVALGLMLGGCGNCGGWTNPWYDTGKPHSCQSDHPSE